MTPARPRRRRGAFDMVPCIVCGEPVTRYTATCRACGAAQPAKSLSGMIGVGGVLVFLLALIAAVLLFGPIHAP